MLLGAERPTCSDVGVCSWSGWWSSRERRLPTGSPLLAALSIVMNMFNEGAERNNALGIWGALGAARPPSERSPAAC